MNVFAIVLGLFLFFAHAFSGQLNFATVLPLISAITLMLVGITSIINRNKKTLFYLSIASFITYLPALFVLFTEPMSDVWFALFFNAWIMVYIGLLVNYHKPNKAIKKDV